MLTEIILTRFFLLFSTLLTLGQLAIPENPLTLLGKGGWIELISTIINLVIKNASPTIPAANLYLSLILLQLLLAFTMPGFIQEGLPVSSLGGKTLKYNCNAFVSLYATIIIVGTCHFTSIFNLADIIELYGPLLTVASITGFVLAGIIYILGDGYRMSGNLIYDYFMGSILNPRLGSVDIKMWAEIRISWTLLFALAMGAVAKQYQDYGYVSANVILFAYGTGLYLNACAKVSLIAFLSFLLSELHTNANTVGRENTAFLKLGVSQNQLKSTRRSISILTLFRIYRYQLREGTITFFFYTPFHFTS